MGRILRRKLIDRPKSRTTDGETASEPQQGSSVPDKSSAASVGKQPMRAPVRYPGKRYVDMAAQFLREVRVELRKVTWPSRKQTIGSTIVVIVLVLIIAAFLGLVDTGLSGLVNVVLQ